ncbi:cell division protein FtsZ [Cardinium endosymbiont of Culicoides punctatus]|uniref:cell division protein FtsZ n=1 Tax=Cardinium endosymbiont of Culicoides punctatus TaxID=2304601 RepID=UPI001058A61C|nr:cell division protein FtsZ [Cardinium endosymbiont of Culicoides punctatus]TDG95337.1 Cell division protein FtsZ [Cardinium endosymbiont of Culicoides punctatus]
MKDIRYKFDLPSHHKSIIKVIGVGGGGSNAINNMYKRGIKDVSFIVCNTDVQALQNSPIQNKLQIGAALTSGLGAGANPEVGRNAALESKESIRELLDSETKMLFITAGMGGGTGTGAAPVIASIARKQDILTVGIVTLPFSFEGKKKYLQAQEGINELRKHCDTVLIILNDKIQTTLGNLSISKAFLEADNVLTTAAKSIAEIITVPGYVNVDFEDVKTVMKGAGAAVMGSGEAEGEDRALRAAAMALASPLLDYTDIRGAKKILLSIVSGQTAELQMDELTVITNYIQEQTGNDSEMIFGHGSDSEMTEGIRVTVIATGFNRDQVTDNVRIFDYKKQDVGSMGRSMHNEHTYPLSSQPLINKHKSEMIQKEDAIIFHAPLTKKKGITASNETAPVQLTLPFTKSQDIQPDKEWKYIHRITGNNKYGNKERVWEDFYIKEQLEIPAYLRKKIQLDEIDANMDVNQDQIRYDLEDKLDK